VWVSERVGGWEEMGRDGGVKEWVELGMEGREKVRVRFCE
jgi:hypothetical protein